MTWETSRTRMPASGKAGLALFGAVMGGEYSYKSRSGRKPSPLSYRISYREVIEGRRVPSRIFVGARRAGSSGRWGVVGLTVLGALLAACSTHRPADWPTYQHDPGGSR